ncbi:MAG TPA: thioredoxin domain-containing protein [Burkholderiaceae bacterium]|nr:thioredoxin domain-containing protein [Burkholderiaceae bacterium]
MTTNRLGQESSPYLRQHARNPVDWYPWGAEALERARRENRPILLSIGYSACHWCHVMAHESFEDPATAALMNRLYVNIKVDREERPDLDHLYQTTHRLLSERSGGGWPLTVLLSPDQVPFFSGTYFPPTPRHGLPAFTDLLERAERIFRSQPQDIAHLAVQLREALEHIDPRAPAAGQEWDLEPVESAVAALRAQIDPIEGGIGGARTGPKFPQPQRLSFGLRHMPEPVLLTLRKMADGGIYDQVGGGFCRYSVDAHWTIPHFEKMLYDNGALLALYADAWLLTGEARFAQVIEQSIAWAVREMRAGCRGFYSALDADAEGEEGRFYVWSREEVTAILGADELAVVRQHYGLDSPPNFEGRWHLRVARPLDAVARALGRPPRETDTLLQSARVKLLRVRSARVRPGLDDKILTSWNALMVHGLARAARVFGRADWLALAQGTTDFLRTDLVRDGRLYATFQGGTARHGAYLDDFAFLLDALLELMQARFRLVDLEFACALAQTLLERFEDPQAGGFFFTSHDHEALLHRAKPVEDNATPGGNGVAAFALQRLAHVTGNPAYAAAAARTLDLFHAYLRRVPHAVPSLLAALEEHVTLPRLVVLRGPEPQVLAWQRALEVRFDPHRIVLAIPGHVDGLPPFLSHPATAEVAAYVCVGTRCQPAIASLDELHAALA